MRSARPNLYTVTCADGASPVPLMAWATVGVTLLQQNRVQVAGFLGTGAGVSAPSAALAAAGNDVALSTQGATLVITGFGFGYTAARIAAGTVQVPVSATYGPVTGAEYSLGACSITAAGVAGGLQNVTCPAVPPGAGSNLAVIVTSNGMLKSAPSVRLFSYMPPIVTAVTVAGPISTAGGTTITVTGSMFGPATTAAPASASVFARLSYGQPGAEGTYQTSNCAVQTLQTVVTCAAAAGVGAGLSFVLTVGVVPGASASAPFQAGAQSSAPFAPAAPAVSYAAPVVATVSAPATADTRGGGSFNLTGSNFGPVGITTLQAVYGRDLAGLSQPVFRSTSCVVTVAHTGATCVMAPGIGAAFSVALSVLNQASAPVFTTLAYSAPQLLSPFLGGSGLTTMSTQGGAQVILFGNFFGPAGLLLSDGVTPVNPNASYGHPGALIYAAQSCVVSVPHTQLTCLSAPGAGAGLVWQAIIGGQQLGRRRRSRRRRARRQRGWS